MRLILLLSLIAVPQLLAAAEDDAEVRKKLVGVWKGQVQNGATGHELTFTTDLITGIKDGSRDLGKGSFKLDLTTTPWRMDAVEIKDGKKGRGFLGIVSLDKDSLKWCVGTKGRPEKFSTGDGSFFLVLKRQKGKPGSPPPAKPKQPAKTVNYTLAELAEAAPEVLSAQVRKTLAKSGLRITGSDGKVLGDVWLRVDVPVPKDFEKTDRQYPLESGTLIGAMRIAKKDAGDFRDLKIAPGVYTMRYGLQPTDDAHEFSKQFRDFVVLLSASADKDPARIADEKDLSKRGIEMTGEPHPAILYLRAPQERHSSLPKIARAPATDGNTGLQVLAAWMTAKGNWRIPGIQIGLVIAGSAKE